MHRGVSQYDDLSHSNGLFASSKEGHLGIFSEVLVKAAPSASTADGNGFHQTGGT